MSGAVKAAARRMARPNSAARLEAERMMGVSFEDMTAAQRLLAAECIAAFGENGEKPVSPCQTAEQRIK